MNVSLEKELAQNKKWPEDSWKFKVILTVGRVSYEIRI